MLLPKRRRERSNHRALLFSLLGLVLAGCLTEEPPLEHERSSETSAELRYAHGHHRHLSPSGDTSGITDYNNLMEALNHEPLGATAYIRCGQVDRPVGGLSGEVALEDGDSVTLEDATGSVATFEFDFDGSVSGGALGVPLVGTGARDVADALADTINAHSYAAGYPDGLRISAQALYGDEANPGFFMANVLLTQTVAGPDGNGRRVEVAASDPWFDGQSTFEGGASGAGGGRVNLAAGTFTLSRAVRVERFDGRLIAAGQHRTIVDAVIEDPTKTVGGGFGYAYDPWWGAAGYLMGAGHFVFSFPRNVTVQGLTLRVPENIDEGGNYYGPGDWELYDGSTALNSFALTVSGSLADERPRVVIRDVGAVGGRGDAFAGLGPEDAVNMQYGFFVGLGQDINTPEPGQGNIRYEGSSVDNGPWRSFVVANIGDESSAVIRNCTVRNGGDGLRVVFVDDADVLLLNNTIDLNRGFPPIWGVGAFALIDTSGVRAVYNTISGRSASPLFGARDNLFVANDFVDLEPDFIFYDGPRAAFVAFSGSESNTFVGNRYRDSGLVGFNDPTSPAGAVYLEAGTSRNVVREVGRWSTGTNVCDMVWDATDDPATPAYDGANDILLWDRLCAAD